MPCSFCGSSLHNVRGCRDPKIGLLCERIKVIYIRLMNRNEYNVEENFKLELNLNFTLKELRAVCATHKNCMLSRPKSLFIVYLYEYYKNNIYILIQEEEQLTNILPTTPDRIPDFARDLEVEEEEEDNDITWYIDRTPTQVSGIPFTIQQEQSTLDHINYEILRYITGGDLVRIREFITPINLLNHFNAVSGNIPFTSPQVKKYNIVIVKDEDELKDEDEECAICYENIKCMNLVKLNCGHRFCGGCVNGWLKEYNISYKPTCALCRKEIKTFTVNKFEVYDLLLEHCYW